MELSKIRVTGAAVGALGVGGAILVSAGATAAPHSANHQAKAKALAAPAVSGTAVQVAPGGHGLASVNCPAGSIVTGGGGTTSAFNMYFTDSFASGNGWTIRATNTGSTTASLTAVARCLTAT